MLYVIVPITHGAESVPDFLLKVNYWNRGQFHTFFLTGLLVSKKKKTLGKVTLPKT